MTVAGHRYDICAANALGLSTAFVARPGAFRPEGEVDAAYDNEFDANAADFCDFATWLTSSVAKSVGLWPSWLARLRPGR